LRAPSAKQGKRLLIALTSLCAEGTPVLTLDLCRQWKGMGIQPTVITLSASPKDLQPEFARADIAVHEMNLPGSGRRRYARMVAFTHEICRRFRPDAFLSMPVGWHAFMAFGARLAGVRAIAAHVGNYPPSGAGVALFKFRCLVQAGRPVTTKLICCSSYVQQGVVEHFGVAPRETVVVYNGVDVGAIERRAAGSRAHSGGSGAFAVGMVARLEGHKDQPTLIRAAKILKDSGRPIEVWLIGEGSRRAEYEQLVVELGLVDTVKLLGMRRDIPELLGQLDAFAFAAKPDEGLGVALVEAMAAGVPIVATDVGACREVLDEGGLGTLVPPSDPHALATALDGLREDPDAAAERRRRAQRKAVEVFSIESMAASYAECLSLLVTSRTANGAWQEASQGDSPVEHR
jgi:glycosyltransferase involved in cell wall biosynthesis